MVDSPNGVHPWVLWIWLTAGFHPNELGLSAVLWALLTVVEPAAANVLKMWKTLIMGLGAKKKPDVTNTACDVWNAKCKEVQITQSSFPSLQIPLVLVVLVILKISTVWRTLLCLFSAHCSVVWKKDTCARSQWYIFTKTSFSMIDLKLFEKSAWSCSHSQPAVAVTYQL